MAQELPRSLDPHSLHASTRRIGGISQLPQAKLQPYKSVKFYQIFGMWIYTAQTRSPPTDDFLSMVLDPQFVSFLPRRIEDSATVIWVYRRLSNSDLCLQTMRL